MNFFLLFSEGVISALSPCVLPILPLYIGYLSQNAKQVDEQGNITYRQSSVILYTLSFIAGIAMTFVILALSMMKIAEVFSDYRFEFSIIGGIFVVLMGLYQIGIIQIPWLAKDRRIQKKLDIKNMNFITAFLMGFFFSFAWTPCIGPALSGVLVLAASQTFGQAMLMILCYTLGFSIPFLFLALFTEIALTFLKKRQAILQNLIKIGGIILIGMGLFMMFQGFQSANLDKQNTSNSDQSFFTLKDQNGKTHTLDQYKDQKVMVTFFATWCTYCNKELDEIQSIYESDPDFVILTVIQPGNNDLSKAEIITWLTEHNYTFPVLFDDTGEVFQHYNISGFPTTYFVNKDQSFYGFAPGFLGKDEILQIITKMEGK